MSVPNMNADPRVIIFDIESFVNVFSLSAKHAATGTRWRFEYSHRRDDRPAMFQWLLQLRTSASRMVGFNNVGFDYPVLHYILNTPDATPASINEFVQRIINADHARRFDHIIWDRDRYVEQVDLYKIHHFDNVARATSLKVLEFNMRSGSIQDLPFAPGKHLTDAEIDALLRYNDHDVDQTEAFYHHSLPAIEFREVLSERYGRNFLNDNDTKIGKQYFIMRLEEAAPGTCYTQGPSEYRMSDESGQRSVELIYTAGRRPRQTIRESIALRDVIFPWIKFKRPEFTGIQQWLAAQAITETKGVFEKLHCVVNGFQFDFGTGGVHGSVTNRIIRSDDTHVIQDWDVESYYPNLGIKNRVYPQHLGELFCDIYADVFEQRKSYPKGTPENAMLKLALNGVYGDSNNKYSPFYDPAYTMSITINGQLLLCLLADYLMDIPGLEMIQVNTDGLTIRIPRERETDVTAVTEWWQSHTLLRLEKAEYGMMALRDVNSYLAVKPDGKLKRKGAYEYVPVDQGGTLGWHQNHSALVVPMAAEAALVEGVPVREFIENHDVLHDFMLRTKVPRNSQLWLEHSTGQWAVYLNHNDKGWGEPTDFFNSEEEAQRFAKGKGWYGSGLYDAPVAMVTGRSRRLQNITRYFVAKQGGSLVKVMPPLAKAPGKERRIGVTVGWSVQEANDLAGVRGTDINMEYYIQEAEKLVRPLRG